MAQLPYGLEDTKAHCRMAWAALMDDIERVQFEGSRMAQMMEQALAQRSSLRRPHDVIGLHASMIDLMRVFIRRESLTLEQVANLTGEERDVYTVAMFAWEDVKERHSISIIREALLLNDAYELNIKRLAEKGTA